MMAVVSASEVSTSPQLLGSARMCVTYVQAASTQRKTAVKCISYLVEVAMIHANDITTTGSVDLQALPVGPGLRTNK